MPNSLRVWDDRCTSNTPKPTLYGSSDWGTIGQEGSRRAQRYLQTKKILQSLVQGFGPLGHTSPRPTLPELQVYLELVWLVQVVSILNFTGWLPSYLSQVFLGGKNHGLSKTLKVLWLHTQSATLPEKNRYHSV